MQSHAYFVAHLVALRKALQLGFSAEAGSSAPKNRARQPVKEDNSNHSQVLHVWNIDRNGLNL